MRLVYEAGLSDYEDFVLLRLIERNTALSIRYATIIIAMPINQCSTCRMKGLFWTLFVEALFILGLTSIEGIVSARNGLPRLEQLILPHSGRSIHRRLYP